MLGQHRGTKWVKLLYHLYLESDMWSDRRRRALELACWKCEWPECGDEEHLQVHHMTYDRVGEERDEDLIVLCTKHHKQVHARGQLAPRNLLQVVRVRRTDLPGWSDKLAALGSTIKE